MQEQLLRLLDVQKLDIQAADLDREKRHITRELDEINRHYEQAVAEFEQGKEEIKQLKVSIKSTEIKLETQLERVNKLESQQSLVKTNQEYKALDKEIIDTRAVVAVTEEEMLKKMEEIEEATTRNLQQEAQAEQEKKLVSDKENEIKARVNDIEQKIKDLRQQRDILAEKVEKRLLRTYTRIFNNRKMPALVPIINQACQGCHLKVPPSVEAQVRRRDRLVTCENCSRILYYTNEADPEQ